jgi:hypothetical protein
VSVSQEVSDWSSHTGDQQIETEKGSVYIAQRATIEETRFGPAQPDAVLSRGRIVVEGDRFVGRAGQGEFLRRATYALVNG